MTRALFIDITDKEINTYIFDVGQGRYELKENRKYTPAEKYDFPAEAIAGGFDNVYLSLPACLSCLPEPESLPACLNSAASLIATPPIPRPPLPC